jgi:hypothetical protein
MAEEPDPDVAAFRPPRLISALASGLLYLSHPTP